MSESSDRPDGYRREFPVGTKRITTGCQYCAVGCGYNAFLVPDDANYDARDRHGGVIRFISDSMTNTVRLGGQSHEAAIVPDYRCDLNKGNHSVRGGSQGENLVTHDGSGRSTDDRLKSPEVRLEDGSLVPIKWKVLEEVMARLVIHATQMRRDGNRIEVGRPEALGAKLYEYQYLENTYAATKLLYSCIGTPNVAYHDRPSAAGSSPGLEDAGFRPHDFSYDDVRHSDVLVFVGTNPYENQSVFFMQYCQGKEIIVIDPRRTATAQYAVETGGLHLQPTKLGADSVVLYAIAREVLHMWTNEWGNALERFPLRSGVGTDPLDLDVEDELPKAEFEKKRRASRTLSFDAFANDFLQVDDDESSPYTLDKASSLSGIPVARLKETAGRLFDPLTPYLAGQPKVALFYEKGMIWGFNYHNTAAIGSLGLLLGAYSEPGRLVGRVGGHQKGWAESRERIDVFADSDTEGYPFRHVQDTYSDDFLKDRFEPGHDFIKVHHNLDNHVFGVPDDFIQDDHGDGTVLLNNGLTSTKEPDVRLLWIVGGNYFGQTNDADLKRLKLADRLKKGGSAKVTRPKKATVDAIVSALSKRIDDGSIVLVHQELFANPTTELCDLVIPAAGWGEDAFCRYNAQRRLKLYDRFQDVPLNEDEPSIADPSRPSAIDAFEYSPKSDWRIFRDIARHIGAVLDDTESGSLEKALREAFPWDHAFQVADEMAERSHRASFLGDVLHYGRARGVNQDTAGVVHTVLGKDDNGDASHLQGNEKYAIPGESAVYGNGVASNGILLPARAVRSGDGTIRRLEGTLSIHRNGPFHFVAAPWEEIKDVYTDNLPDKHKNEIFITNGRFNHLWNNMFHHLRNDYVNERFPADLPGTILEVNRDWAARESIANGDLVRIESPRAIDGAERQRQFFAVASIQDSVPDGGAFAMFSYPVRDAKSERFDFDGYVNNGTAGYADGINPIAALKYGRGVVTKVKPSPRNVGTHAQRSVITNRGMKPVGIELGTEAEVTAVEEALQLGDLPAIIRWRLETDGILLPGNLKVHRGYPADWPDSVDWRTTSRLAGRSSAQVVVRLIAAASTSAKLEAVPTVDRIVWDMREVIVRKGLLQAADSAHGGYAEFFLMPDHFIRLLLRDRRLAESVGEKTLPAPRSRMSSVWDEWPIFEHEIVARFLEHLGSERIDRKDGFTIFES